MNKILQNSLFYVVVFCVTYFIYVYPFEILNELIFNELVNRRVSFYYTIIISILIIFYFRSYASLKPLRVFVYEGMGIGFISFWIVTIAYFSSKIILIDSQVIGIAALVIILLLSLIAFYYGNKVFSKKIDLTSHKIKDNVSFVFISDIHLGSNSERHLLKIINEINKCEIDFLLIGGDLIDSSSASIASLKHFKNLKCPIYFVTGNHEYYIKNSNSIISNLNKYNIKHISNKSVTFNDLNLIGIDDNLSKEQQIKLLNNNLKETNYNLLLVHKPSIWTEVNDNLDLMLSGHTHNGQIFPFNLLVRTQFKFKYGFYNANNSYLYVSSGSGPWGPKMRLGTFNEVIVFNLSPK